MRRSVLVALSVLSLSAAGAAYAQEAPTGLTADDLNQLHNSLHLSAAQEPAWQSYVAALSADPAAETRREQASQMMPGLTTPRRVDLLSAEMEAETAAMRRQGQAVKTFYYQLTPEQQRTFDAQTYRQPKNKD